MHWPSPAWSIARIMCKPSSRSVVALSVLFLLLGVSLAVPGRAQVPAAAFPEGEEAVASTGELAEHHVAPDSPRESLTAYLGAGRKGEWEKAARYVVVPEGGEGPVLAERLKAVLDKHVWLDLQKISPKSDSE